MISPEFTLAVLLGALIAVPYCLRARRGERPALYYGAGLTVAAAIYVGLALGNFDRRGLLLELAGVVLFCGVAIAGARWSEYLLAAGWLAHVAWDLPLHPIGASGYAPWWYPVLCVGFDLLVAGFILADAAARAGPRP